MIFDLGLAAIWEFIKQILGDSIRDRLKPKDSATRAKERIFNVYRSLDIVSKQTQTFVDTLEAASAEFGHHLSRRPDFIVTAPLAEVMARLLESINSLASALDAVNPQLDVRKHQLVTMINTYIAARSGLIYGLQMSVEDEKRIHRKDFEQLLATAQENAVNITSAVANLREFIATEFEFKESF